MYSNIYSYLKSLTDTDILTIIECGGHTGSDTIELSNIFKNGIIYCIEANSILYNNLIEKCSDIKNIKLFNNALSNKNAEIDFYIDENPEGDAGASSLLESSEFYLKNHIKQENLCKVQGITLDKFLLDNNITNVDLLWLDIEGFEYYVLENNVNILKNIKYIYTEVNFQQFRKGTKLYDDINKLLLDNNFSEIEKWSQGDEWGHWQGNVLFKNNLY